MSANKRVGWTAAISAGGVYRVFEVETGRTYLVKGGRVTPVKPGMKYVIKGTQVRAIKQLRTLVTDAEGQRSWAMAALASKEALPSTAADTPSSGAFKPLAGVEAIPPLPGPQRMVCSQWGLVHPVRYRYDLSQRMQCPKCRARMNPG
jgi:hypothetical protein